jgi:hypothetical protein
VIKSKKLRRAGHVIRMERCRSGFKILTDKQQEVDLYKCLDVDGRTILEYILKKNMSMQGIGLIRLRIDIIGELLLILYWISEFHNPWS